MPLDTTASAIWRSVLSSILSANLFQLFQPMGGVRARSAARHADARSSARRKSSAKTRCRFIAAIECIACEAWGLDRRTESSCDGQDFVADQVEANLCGPWAVKEKGGGGFKRVQNILCK